jgi:hypothetical protein
MTKASEGIGDGGLALMRALANDRRKLVEWWKDYTGETVNKDSESISRRRRVDDPTGGSLAQNDPNTQRFPGDDGFPGTPPGGNDPRNPGNNGDPGGTTFPIDPPAGGNPNQLDPPTRGTTTQPLDPPTRGTRTPPLDPPTGGATVATNDVPQDPMTGGRTNLRGNDTMTGGTTVPTGNRVDPMNGGTNVGRVDPMTAGTNVASVGRTDPMTGGGMKVSGLKSVAPVQQASLTRPTFLPTGVMPKPKALEWLSARGDESSFALKQALSGKAAA